MKRKEMFVKKTAAYLAVGAFMISLCGCSNAAAGDYMLSDTAADNAGWSYEADVEQEASLAESKGTDASSAEYSQKLIKTYNFGIESTDIEKTTSLIREKTEKYGGYIENSYVYDGGDYANYTIRIPEENADAFINDTDEFGTKTYQSESREDITLSYYDTASHIEALKVQHERLLTLMESAEEIDDIVALEERLSDVEYELSSYESTLKIYDNRVEYVTVNMDVSRVSVVSAVGDDSFSDRIKKGLLSNLNDLGSFFVELAILIITGLPYII